MNFRFARSTESKGTVKTKALILAIELRSVTDYSINSRASVVLRSCKDLKFKEVWRSSETKEVELYRIKLHNDNEWNRILLVWPMNRWPAESFDIWEKSWHL